MREQLLLALGYCLTSRIAELFWSRRNERHLARKGGRRIEPDGLGALIAAHVGWLLAMPLEDWSVGPAGLPNALRIAALALFVGSELMRAWCVAALGERWTVRVVILPDVPNIQGGPYRWLRHPNYLAVAVGVVALPLALDLPWTAGFGVAATLAAMRRRVRVEDAAPDCDSA